MLFGHDGEHLNLELCNLSETSTPTSWNQGTVCCVTVKREAVQDDATLVTKWGLKSQVRFIAIFIVRQRHLRCERLNC